MTTMTTGRTYLTQETSFAALVERMQQTPSYRPAGFAAGPQGVAQAREYLEDLREAVRDLNTEGDG